MAAKPARPTEYKGVVYRSKSEAMFAASLDYQHKKWLYEPSFCELKDGWRPDFVLPIQDGNRFFFQAIEYKPARITETCRNELRDRFTELAKLLFPVQLDAYVVLFNWFDPTECNRVLSLSGGELSVMACATSWCITSESYEHARYFRFDIEDSLMDKDEMSLLELMALINKERERRGIHAT
jgi:hypothetical protein